MLIQDENLGSIEVGNIPVPGDMTDFYGTYTYSGRVLVSDQGGGPAQKKDWYHVISMEDDGSRISEVFNGEIPQLEGANGIRWMCFPDNRRILLGDYVLECEPDIDHCIESKLVTVRYPEELTRAAGIFMRWSEVIIAPDNVHMCWTTLTYGGAVNYLGRLIREEDGYVLKEVCVVSTAASCMPDPEHAGCVLPLPVRGGEVKQFIQGGRALTMVGNADSISESVVQSLDSEEVIQITDTPGYEETTIFSPDETLGVVMSPRFSPGTNCAVFGLVPQPHAMAVRSRVINIFYMYSVNGVRMFRAGNVGPVLIETQKSRTGGRSYTGINLSDPEGRWVYYSPISWHPDSRRAMWNERTRRSVGEQKCRLRMCRLTDRKPGRPVPAAVTPDADAIPYALAVDCPDTQTYGEVYPMKIMGKAGGYVINDCSGGAQPVCETLYHDFSDDGKTYYNGLLKACAPDSLFAPGETVFEADLTVSGEHTGEMKLRAVFRRDGVHAPAMLSFTPGPDGLPESHGWSEYDGVVMKVEDMEP